MVSSYMKQQSANRSAAAARRNGGAAARPQTFKGPRGMYGLPRGTVRLPSPKHLMRGVPRFGAAAFYSPIGVAIMAASLAMSAATGSARRQPRFQGGWDPTGWENTNGCYLTNIWARNADATSGTCGANTSRSRSVWNNNLGVFTSVSPYKVMDFAGDAWDIGPNTVGYTRGASWRAPRDAGSDADQKPMRRRPSLPVRSVPDPYMGKNAGRHVSLDPAFFPPLATRPMPWPMTRPDLKSPPSPYRQPDLQRQASSPKTMRGRDKATLPSYIGEYTPPSHNGGSKDSGTGTGSDFKNRIRFRRSTHRLEKPPSRVKEKKVKVNTQGFPLRVVAGVTEMIDVIDVFYKVLPDGYKTKKYGATPQDKLRDIYNHFDYYQSPYVMDKVLEGLVIENLEDRNWAMLGKMGGQTSIDLDRPYGAGINSIISNFR